MLTFNEFKEACKQDLPDEAVVYRGKAKSFKTGEEFNLIGYKWQSYVDFLNNLDIIWSKEIRTIKDYPEHQKMATCVRIHIKCSDGEPFFDGYGVAEFKDKEGKLDMSLTGKSAVDDALGRACALFGLGMTAYKGLEDRKPIFKEGKDYQKLFKSLRESKKLKLGIATDPKLIDFLIEKEFDFEWVEIHIDTQNKSLDWEPIKKEDYEKLYKFIEEKHPMVIRAKLIKKYKELVGNFKKQEGEIKDLKDFKLPPYIYGAFGKLAKQFGNKLLEKVDELPISSVNTIESWVRYLTGMCQEKQELNESTEEIG